MLQGPQILEFNENKNSHISSFTIANDDTYKTTLKVKVRNSSQISESQINQESNKLTCKILTFSTHESLYSTMKGLRTLDISSICKTRNQQ